MAHGTWCSSGRYSELEERGLRWRSRGVADMAEARGKTRTRCIQARRSNRGNGLRHGLFCEPSPLPYIQKGIKLDKWSRL